MSELALARWQFGITTVYHFIFVPLTIGLSVLVACMQTAWCTTKRPVYLRMTKFWGKLFLINFAIGVVTGIVQEFQFGMNWSAYSRFVGDIFGAPLAMEGLIAFYLESTFLGLWIFGWNRLSPKLHLAAIWMVAIGTNISAVFILAANSWMQNPVGFTLNAEKNRAELTSIADVLTNKVALVTIPHTLIAAFMTAALFVLGISGWHLLRDRGSEVFQKSARIGLIVGFVTAVATMGVGHVQSQIMTEVQPMKMAAAEALWNTEKNAPLSLFAIGDVAEQKNHINVSIPSLLSLLATNHPDGTVKGIIDLNGEMQQKYGAGDYRPIIPIAYWTFRVMAGVAFAVAAFCLLGLVLLYRHSFEKTRWFLWLTLPVLFLPFIGNAFGWIFTEMARQPWTVFGVMRTADAVSPGVPAGSVLATLIGFTLLYGILAYIEFRLLWKYAKAGPPSEEEALAGAKVAEPDTQPALVY